MNHTTKEKEMRYSITKIKNGLWRLEWENGSFSEHSTQYGAENMVQSVLKNVSHPTSMEERLVELFKGNLALSDDAFQAVYEKLHIFPALKQFIHQEIQQGKREVLEGIEEYFKGLIHVSSPRLTKENLIKYLSALSNN